MEALNFWEETKSKVQRTDGLGWLGGQCKLYRAQTGLKFHTNESRYHFFWWLVSCFIYFV